jgi:uncharacterized membrane protein YtjA (UPF0391 family)
VLRYPGLFLLLALIAGAFGYGGLAGNLAEFLQTLLFVFVALAALGCVINRTQEPMDRDLDGWGDRTLPLTEIRRREILSRRPASPTSDAPKRP